MDYAQFPILVEIRFETQLFLMDIMAETGTASKKKSILKSGFVERGYTPMIIFGLEP